MKNKTWLVIKVGGLLFIVLWLVAFMRWGWELLPRQTIVVNLPKDAAPLSCLPTNAPVAGDKAILWWTVYKYTRECGSLTDAAIKAADAATAAAYPAWR